MITNRLKERRRELRLPDHIKVDNKKWNVLLLRGFVVLIERRWGETMSYWPWMDENHICLFSCKITHQNRASQPSLKLSYWLMVCLQCSLCLLVQEMTHYQMALEKTSMQKCLLYFESLHGRPVRTNSVHLLFLTLSSLILFSLFLTDFSFFVFVYSHQ